jgi:hypothetical protein
MSAGPESNPNQQIRRLHIGVPEHTTMRATPNPAIHELDQRSEDGIDVRLLWNSLTNRVSVAVEDQRTARAV